MNIFGFRPFKGKFSLGDSDDIPANTDGTLIGAVKQINNDLSDKADKTDLGNKVTSIVVTATPLQITLPAQGKRAIIIVGCSNATKAIVLVEGGLSSPFNITHFITASGISFSVNGSILTITNTNAGNYGTAYGCIIPLP